MSSTEQWVVQVCYPTLSTNLKKIPAYRVFKICLYHILNYKTMFHKYLLGEIASLRRIIPNET
ncbi:hypothetical protein PBCV1_A384aL [Paramecium bursaria Chlorella virus 1]|uniref:Uncharacterized protein n=1 Tax=Paramecium bursaria Chlorella virus 1 TaxID=10506 RepID=F8TU27_PBCV1|nr:hypothetical protein PBCV1_A384aL [Paramecium bursaria Chlorella virus 1]AEI70088.1 hypothetical protein [Paramecium bursaria Chlorella virus 1]